MKVTYEFLEHGWVKRGDRVKIYDEEGIVNQVEKRQLNEYGQPTGGHMYFLHITCGNIIRSEEFREDLPSYTDIKVVDVELIQARIAEFAAAKLEEANKAFQTLKEQFKDLKDLVSQFKYDQIS